jgi:hypothetical protein
VCPPSSVELLISIHYSIIFSGTHFHGVWQKAMKQQSDEGYVTILSDQDVDESDAPKKGTRGSRKKNKLISVGPAHAELEKIASAESDSSDTESRASEVLPDSDDEERNTKK